MKLTRGAGRRPIGMSKLGRRARRPARLPVAAAGGTPAPVPAPRSTWPTRRAFPSPRTCLRAACCRSSTTVEQMAWGFDPKDKGSWVVPFRARPGGGRNGGKPPDESDSVRGMRPRGLGQSKASSPGRSRTTTTRRGRCTACWATRRRSRERWSWSASWRRAASTAGDPSGYADPRAKALEAGAARWRLLLQLDTDDDAAMMWGDLGRLYFWITDDALRRRAFDEVWMVLQCS